MSTVIVDYGVGNLFSLRQSLLKIGEAAVVSGDAAVIQSADRVILPGVGAFGDAAAKLRETKLDNAVIAAAKVGTPLLGICLGMQLLFEKSYEFGEHAGLGLIPGEIRNIAETTPPAAAGTPPEEGKGLLGAFALKIPQIGWNNLSYKTPSPIYKNTPEGAFVYFVHSYHAVCPAEYITAVTDYGGEITASVQNGSVYGTQYHPEKSGDVGLQILRDFLDIIKS